LEENRDILFTLKTTLNSFSVRLLKCSACGDRARSTPHTSLEPARPRGKQRQSFGLLQDSHQSELVIEKRRQQSLGTERMFNLTKPPAWGLAFIYLSEVLSMTLFGLSRLFPWPYLDCQGYSHDLIWISKVIPMTLFGLSRLFPWPYLD